MDESYLAKLPSEVQSMVAEVESAINQEIVVRKPSGADPDFVQSSELAYCQCSITPDGLIAEIVFPLDDTPTHQIAHEVTHIHRSFIQQVDRLSAKVQNGGIQEQIAMGIENDLEHILMVPAEIQCFPESLAFWERDFEQQLEFVRKMPHIGTLPFQNAVLSRLDMIRSFATASLILPLWRGLTEYAELLQRQGVINDACKLADKLRKHQDRKLESIATMLRFAKIERSGFEVARFDTVARTEKKTPVPAQ